MATNKNGHIAASNYLFNKAQGIYAFVAVMESWIASGIDAWGERYSPSAMADMEAEKNRHITEAEWYQEQSDAFLNNRPPEKPEIGERPSWFPPYQEGMRVVTVEYPRGVTARVMDLRHAWFLYTE